MRVTLTKRKWEVPDPGYVVVPTPPEEWVTKEQIVLSDKQFDCLFALVDVIRDSETGAVTVDVDGESFQLKREE